jgi:hypothetical protein
MPDAQMTLDDARLDPAQSHLSDYDGEVDEDA